MGSVMRKDDLNVFHSVTHLLVISNMEEKPSLDGLQNRSEQGGKEEN